MVNLIILICLVDLVLVDLAASPQVASANSNQDLHRILEDNLLDLEHKQVDLEEEQAASDNKVDLLSNRIHLVLVNRQIQEVLGEVLDLKLNLNSHQHSGILGASDKILRHNNLVYLEVVLEEEQVVLDNKVDLLSNRILLDSAVVLVRNHLNLNQ